MRAVVNVFTHRGKQDAWTVVATFPSFHSFSIYTGVKAQ